MNTQITVADARKYLYKEVDASDPNSTLFIPALNEACERLTNSGYWKSSVEYVKIPSSSKGFFTLPRQYASVLAGRYRGLPQMMFTQFYPFSISGAARREDLDDKKYLDSVMHELGDGFVTQDDIKTASRLRISIFSPVDALKNIRLFGTDSLGNPVMDMQGRPGINVTTADPTVDTGIYFSEITGIEAPVMVSPWILSAIDPVEYNLGVYQPGELRPCYKRYHTGVRDKPIECLAARRFIPLVNETDWVYPGNISALRYGLQMLAFEAAGQQEQAEAAYQGAMRFLNEEARYARGGSQPTINYYSINAGGVQIGA